MTYRTTFKQAFTHTVVEAINLRGRHGYKESLYGASGNLLKTSYSTILGGAVVKIIIKHLGDKSADVSFEVNDGLDHVGGTGKGRWLLAAWKHVLAEHAYDAYWCMAYGADGYGETRTSIFTKLGFIDAGDDDLVFYTK